MPSRNEFSRRAFLRGLGAGVLAVSALVRPGTALAARKAPFQHGVASGDPLSDRVVLWTRVTTEVPRTITVLWEVARDANFRHVICRGTVRTGADRDWTVKVDAKGLPAAARLFYRFRALGQLSPVGRTRTLPTSGIDPFKLAAFSCSNCPAGYFHGYAEAAKLDDVFASIRLGDRIHEYDQDGYASPGANRSERDSRRNTACSEPTQANAAAAVAIAPRADQAMA
jgi:alkaline phosphatase D